MKKQTFAIVFGMIFLLNLDAQEKLDSRQITFNPAREAFPSWSPDGKHLVHQYTDLSDTLGNNGLWKISAKGAGAKQIFVGVAEHPKWSPDGRYIVFDADTGQSIKMISSDGGDPITFLPDTVQISRGGLPCWSPDGSKIAFKDSKHSLCVYDMRSRSAKRLYGQDGMVLLPGCWSADGKYILTAFVEMPSRKSTIWEVSADGKERKQITGHHENFYRYLALSPDGSLLVYAVMEGRYLGLYVMPAEGGSSLPFIVTGDGHNEGPSWSPDGKKIAFSSSRGRNVDIWIMDVNVEQIKLDLRVAQK